MTWKERPVDFVSAGGATATYESHIAFGFRFPDDDTKVISALRTGSSKVDSHTMKLTLPVSPFKLAFKFVARPV